MDLRIETNGTAVYLKLVGNLKAAQETIEIASLWQRQEESPIRGVKYTYRVVRTVYHPATLIRAVVDYKENTLGVLWMRNGELWLRQVTLPLCPVVVHDPVEGTWREFQNSMDNDGKEVKRPTKEQRQVFNFDTWPKDKKERESWYEWPHNRTWKHPKKPPVLPIVFDASYPEAREKHLAIFNALIADYHDSGVETLFL